MEFAEGPIGLEIQWTTPPAAGHVGTKPGETGLLKPGCFCDLLHVFNGPQAGSFSSFGEWFLGGSEVVVGVVPGGAGENASIQKGQALLEINGCPMTARASGLRA